MWDLKDGRDSAEYATLTKRDRPRERVEIITGGMYRKSLNVREVTEEVRVYCSGGLMSVLLVI